MTSVQEGNVFIIQVHSQRQADRRTDRQTDMSYEEVGQASDH